MSSSRVPTVDDILKDRITALAATHWASRATPTADTPATTPSKTSTKKTPVKKGSASKRGKKQQHSEETDQVEAATPGFSNEVVVQIFRDELSVANNQGRVQLLEFSCYLENYIWPHFSSEASFEHVLSIALMVNEKCREGVTAFQQLTAEPEKFESFFKAMVSLWMESSGKLKPQQKSSYIQFLINIYLSLENAVIRRCALSYLSLPMWTALSDDRLQHELQTFPSLRKHWQHLLKEKSKSTSFSSSAFDTAAAEEAPTSAGKKRGRKSTGGSASKKKKNERPAATEDEAQETPPTLTELWIPQLVKDCLFAVESVATPEDIGEQELFVARCLEFFLDLLSQLPTRRFFNALLDDCHFIVRLQRASAWSLVSLFHRLVAAIDDLMHFEIEDQSGKALTRSEVMAAHWSRLHTVQEAAHMHHKDLLRELVFSSTGELGKEEVLQKHLSSLDPEALFAFAVQCRLLSRRDVVQGCGGVPLEVDFAMQVILSKLRHRKGQLDALNHSALYPTEKELWDENTLPASGQGNTVDTVLALPKLNLQFLTMHDYLLRNYTLFKLESSYEIRQDLVDALKRMAPKQGFSDAAVSFGGWARMAMPLKAFSMNLIAKPTIGESHPREVRAVAEVDLSRFQGDIRAEWEELREHDVVFLLCIQNPTAAASAIRDQFKAERRELAAGRKPRSTQADESAAAEDEFSFPAEYGVRYVRGAEVIEMRDEDDVVLNDFSRPDERKGGRTGHKRSLLVRLDPSQYYVDMKEGESCYDSLNLIVRRKSKENNFKAVLETIRTLINTEAIGRAVPSWLYDVILGYGNPASAHYRQLEVTPAVQLSAEVTATAGRVQAQSQGSGHDHDEIFDYKDTFVSADHVRESFPNADLIFVRDVPGNEITAEDRVADEGANGKGGAKQGKKSKSPAKAAAAAAIDSEVSPPYRLLTKRGADGARDSVVCVGYRPGLKGPYPEDAVPLNTVRFSGLQVEAIRSGMNKGLTLVVGPPGTGKTDVAVQIIVNLYHNFPTQKILLVTHSNAALNDLFSKIMERDVDQRHLLRLGSGGKSLHAEDETFTKQGRVDWSLARRMQLLAEVQRMAVELQIAGDVGSTCETAEYFYREHVHPRIEKCRRDLRGSDSPASVAECFPFFSYFSDAPEPLFLGDRAQDTEAAEGCLAHVEKVFQELADYRAFELLRTQGHRADYLLTKQARIVAMTCTHAAMTRSRLVELGFKYDSLIMEEAAQILEVETLIPMLLQNTDEMTGCRLQRAVLIGDHNQLPPVVKHPAFQKHCKLDQSMFTRLIRLGVPTVQLDRQGRARPEMAALYSWRYAKEGSPGLDNLSFVNNYEGEYGRANAGFVFNYQLVDVPEFNGKGEFCPTPFFYQNLGEAEYVVAVYQYMRLLGYPAHKISIITSYNGQKNLIRDVLAQRCRNPVFGFPAAVTTVDKYQGQQNDFVLLSLVRTESVGHLRDIRRLVVALSRARLGMYVFCRKALFENCYELSPAFNQLCSRPTQLQLVAGEGYPCSRDTPEKGAAPAESLNVHTVSDVTEMGVLVYQMVQQAQHTAAAGGAMDTSS